MRTRGGDQPVNLPRDPSPSLLLSISAHNPMMNRDIVVITPIRDMRAMTATRQLTAQIRAIVDIGVMTDIAVHLFLIPPLPPLLLRPVGIPNLLQVIPPRTQTRNRPLSYLSGSMRKGILFLSGMRIPLSITSNDFCRISFRMGDLA
jgi:hypothetical protein